MPSHITKDDTSSSPLQRQARRTLCDLRKIVRRRSLRRSLRRRQATIDGFEGRMLLLQDALIKAEYLTNLLTIEDEENLKKQPRAGLWRLHHQARARSGHPALRRIPCGEGMRVPRRNAPSPQSGSVHPPTPFAPKERFSSERYRRLS